MNKGGSWLIEKGRLCGIDIARHKEHPGAGPDMFQSLCNDKTGHMWHDHVGNKGLDRFGQGRRCPQGLFAICGFCHLVPVLFQYLNDESTNRVLVLDDEEAF